MIRKIATMILFCATVASADPRDWAKRIPCELQTAGVASLPTLELLQGSSPLIACDQYRSGKALTVTNDVQAVMRFSSSLTNTLWVSVTNQSYYSNSYLIQLPSLGTNAVNWVYTILYYKDGAIYWTGTGRLDIKETDVTGNALVWQEVAGSITTNTVNDLIESHNADLTAHASLLAGKVSTERTITINNEVGTLSSNLVFNVQEGLTGSQVTNIAQAVIAPYTNSIATAWQNPASATNWTWTSDGKEITLTSYNFSTGGATVVIPDMLDGLPVTTLANLIFFRNGITSIVGNNIKSIGDGACYQCTSLTNVVLPKLESVGDSSFQSCTNIKSISLPNVINIKDFAFNNCPKLDSITFELSPPTVGTFVLTGSVATNYVTNPTATGWGATFGGRPVVRMGGTFDSVTLGGETRTTWPVGTTNHNDLGGRELPAAHPISAITDLAPIITNVETVVVWSNPPSAGTYYPTTNPDGYINASTATNIFDTMSYIPYRPFSATITPANGTATVVYAHGNMPSLTITSPTVVTLDPTGYGTSGVSRVALSLYCGTNSVTLSTNVITYATTPTLSTNCWNTILIRRVSNCVWKGVQL